MRSKRVSLSVVTPFFVRLHPFVIQGYGQLLDMLKAELLRLSGQTP